MNQSINYTLLRSPLFVASFLLLSIIPEVLVNCSFSEDAPISISSCSREFVYASFIQSSFLSSTIVFFSFEIQHMTKRTLNLRSIPQNLYSWMGAESKLILVCLITFVAFSILRIGIYWISDRAFTTSEIFEVEAFIKAMIIVYLSYHTLVLSASIKARRFPLNQMIDAGENSSKKVEVGSIHFFQKIERKYYLYTANECLPVGLTLRELELKLPEKYFVRVNRAVIVNIQKIDYFNYWEHEKYILKMKSGEEFVVTRKRLVSIKSKISSECIPV